MPPLRPQTCVHDRTCGHFPPPLALPCDRLHGIKCRFLGGLSRRDTVLYHEPQIGFRIEAVHLGGLCRPPNYAERFRNDAWLSRCCRPSRGRWLRTIRHSSVAQSASSPSYTNR
jgi:hypothetical protein